jgi:hypothetical protein
MDIITVVTTLDTYWTVIEAELVEIDKDINQCHVFQRRYGSQYWTKSLTKLQNIKRLKETQVCIILVVFMIDTNSVVLAQRY